MEKNDKIYVAGHRGMVGSAIVRELERQGYTHIITRTHAELDLCRQDQVEEFFAEERPEYVFLAAAKVGGIVANQSALADFMYDNMMLEMNVIHAAWKNGCKKLETVTYTALTEVGEKAFSRCSALKVFRNTNSKENLDTLVRIESQAFSESGIKNITFGACLELLVYDKPAVLAESFALFVFTSYPVQVIRKASQSIVYLACRVLEARIGSAVTEPERKPYERIRLRCDLFIHLPYGLTRGRMLEQRKLVAVQHDIRRIENIRSRGIRRTVSLLLDYSRAERIESLYV